MRLECTASTNVGGRDEAVVVDVLGVVVERRARGLDLLERHAARDHVGDAVAHDDDHVAELDDVGFVADAAVTRDHVRAAFLRLGRHRQVQDLIQARDQSLHAAAARAIDERIAARREQVARADDVGLAEQHDRVAVRVRVRRVIEEHGFAVEVEILGRREIRIGRQAARRRRGLARRRIRQARQRILVRDHLQRLERASALISSASAALPPT